MQICKEKLEYIRSSEAFAAIRKEAESTYASFDKEIPTLSYWDFMDFKRTGVRARFEEKYFIRRKRLNYTVLICLLYERAEDIQQLENIIWAICDEYTWSLPAHINSSWEWEHAAVNVDLFAAETGFALSEILDIFGERLDDLVRKRVHAEIKKRIVDPFLGHVFHWEGLEMNWAAVCGGAVGACFLYAFPELFPLVKDRILGIMDTFLRGFGTDGCCREGVGYWSYGFGFFVYFADLLKKATNGTVDLFQKDIVKKVAGFQQRSFLNKNTIISFSDCGDGASIAPGLTSYLKRTYPEEIKIPAGPVDYLNRGDDAFRFASFIRNFVWSEPAFFNKREEAEQFYYYPSAQWYIRRFSHLTLAAKGGHNDEPHNHNDVGGFILADDETQVLCDLGFGVYNRAYFSDDTRYSIPNTASFGHSVPLIDGQEQQAGEVYAAEVLCADAARFVLRIEKAYSVDGLQQLERSFVINRDITMVDSFVFSAGRHQITERFIFNSRPIIKGNLISSGQIQMQVATECTEITCSPETALRHSGEERTYYAVDCTIAGQKECTFCIRFSSTME